MSAQHTFKEGDRVTVPARRGRRRGEIAELYRGGATVFVDGVPGVMSYIYSDIQLVTPEAASDVAPAAPEAGA